MDGKCNQTMIVWVHIPTEYDLQVYHEEHCTQYPQLCLRSMQTEVSGGEWALCFNVCLSFGMSVCLSTHLKNIIDLVIFQPNVDMDSS